MALSATVDEPADEPADRPGRHIAAIRSRRRAVDTGMSISILQPRSLRPGGPRIAAVALVGLIVVLGACGDDGDSDAEPGDQATGESGAADATLEVVEIEYHDVSAPAGGTLEIVNSSGVEHTFTADDASFDQSYGSDESIAVDVPDEPGDYPFHCEIHPTMTGTLTVE